jgi:hypothetical protein
MAISRRKKAEIQLVDTNRDHWHTDLAHTGHRMAWHLGECSMEPGHAYHWCGQCRECGAAISVYAHGTSCWRSLDARTTDCRPELREVQEAEQALHDAQITEWAATLARRATAPMN